MPTIQGRKTIPWCAWLAWSRFRIVVPIGDKTLPTRALRFEAKSPVHRATRRKPVERLAEERQRLHPLPGRPFTAAFGTTRRVNWAPRSQAG